MYITIIVFSSSLLVACVWINRIGRARRNSSFFSLRRLTSSLYPFDRYQVFFSRHPFHNTEKLPIRPLRQNKKKILTAVQIIFRNAHHIVTDQSSSMRRINQIIFSSLLQPANSLVAYSQTPPHHFITITHTKRRVTYCYNLERT